MKLLSHIPRLSRGAVHSLEDGGDGMGMLSWMTSAALDGAEQGGGAGGVANKAERVVLLVMVDTHHSHGVINTR